MSAALPHQGAFVQANTRFIHVPSSMFLHPCLSSTFISFWLLIHFPLLQFLHLCFFNHLPKSALLDLQIFISVLFSTFHLNVLHECFLPLTHHPSLLFFSDHFIDLRLFFYNHSSFLFLHLQFFVFLLSYWFFYWSSDP